jgi:hypothetical protein
MTYRSFHEIGSGYGATWRIIGLRRSKKRPRSEFFRQITTQFGSMVHKKVGGGRDRHWQLIANNADSDAGDSD